MINMKGIFTGRFFFSSSCLAMLFALGLGLALGLPLAAQAQTGEIPAEVAEARTQVDINTADAETLALALDGIGMAKAMEIIAYREQNGEFTSIEQLADVRGIGPATIDRNRHRMVVSPQE